MEQQLTGSPTLYEYIDSWNAKYPNNKLYTNNTTYIYIGTTSDTTGTSVSMSNTDKLYYPTSNGSTSSYWLATGGYYSNNLGSYVTNVQSGGTISRALYNNTSQAARPLIKMPKSLLGKYEDDTWKFYDYTITYNLDGGTLNSAKYGYNGALAEDYTLPVPTKENCEFIGWTGSNGEIPQINVTIPAGTTADKLYTANWEKISPNIGDNVNYSVVIQGVTLDNWRVFDTDDDNVYMIYGDYLPNNAIMPTTPALTKNGDYAVKAGSRANMVSALTTQSNWADLLYGTVDLSEFGATATGGPTIYEYIESWNKRHPDNKLYARDFKYSGTDGTQIKSDDSDYIASLTMPNTDDLYYPRTMYWKATNGYWLASLGYAASSSSNTVRAIMNNGNVSSISYDNIEYAVRPLIKLPKAVIQSYTNGKWQLTEYGISYYLDGGTMNNATYGYNGSLSENYTLPTPTKENHQFIGWTGSNGENPQLNVTIPEGTSENAIYIANWKKVVPDIGDNIDYSVTVNGETLNKWKVFDVDDENVYVIYEDYLPNTAIGETTPALTTSGSYAVKGSSRADLITALATESNWESLLNGSANLEHMGASATGAPTLDQFISSWNKNYPSNPLSASMYTSNPTEYGYQIKKGTGSLSSIVSVSSDVGYANELYFPYQANTNSTYGYWLATWGYYSTSYTTYVDSIKYDGTIGSNGTYSSTYFAARPLITIPKVVLTKYEDNKWKFMEHSIKYNLDGGTISDAIYVYDGTLETAYTLPIPTKEDFEFIGWTGSNGEIPQLTVTIPAGSSADLTYTAHWNKVSPIIGDDIDYSVTVNGIELNNWKVFDKDDDNIYVIYGDYLPNAVIGTTSPTLTKTGTYGVYGSSRANLITALKTESNWEFLLDGTMDLTELGATATGTPTLDQYISSWNKSYPKNKLYTSTSSYGNYIGKTSGATTTAVTMSNVDTLYYPHSEYWNSIYGYWLATWGYYSTNSTDYVNRVEYSGTIGTSYYSSSIYSIRPLIKIPKTAIKVLVNNKWQFTDYSIRYNLDGGRISNAIYGYDEELEENYTLPTPTKDGYIFVGWTGSNGDTPQVQVTIPAGSMENKEYNANWEKEPTIGDDINYSVTVNSTTLSSWRIFDTNEDYVWMIYGDYLPNAAVGTTNPTLSKYNSYAVYGGSKDYLIEALTKTSNWTSLLNGNTDLSIYGAIATGSPTLQQFISSWNKSYPSNTLSAEMYVSSSTDYGYRIQKGTGSLSTTVSVSGDAGYSNTLYFPHTASWNTTYGYWLATWGYYSTSSTNYVDGVKYDGTIGSNVTNSSYYYAARPVIKIPKKLLNNYENNKWYLGCTANITYDANGGTFANSATTNEMTYQLENGTISATGTYSEPTRANYIFVGWNTKADGTGIMYKTEAEAKGRVEDTTLYARWDYDIDIGTTISYTPPTRTDVTVDNMYATSNSTGNQILDNTGTFQVTSWKVLGVDGDNIEMVPASVPSGTVTLQSAQGYNNAVYLLHKACNDLYGNENAGITARSIREEDFINAQDGTKWTTARAGYYTSISSSTKIYYNNRYSSYSNYRYYPSIYEQEIKSGIDGTENKTGIGWSEQTSLIESTNSSKQASSYVYPYLSYYYFTNSNASSYLKSGYSGLLFPAGTSTNYWIASRCIDISSDRAYYQVRSVDSGNFSSQYVFSSYYSTWTPAKPLFPIVTINSALLEETATAGTYQVVYNPNITYNANGGTFTGGGTTNSVQYKMTSNGTTLSTTGTYSEPTKANYHFAEWNTRADGTGTSYKTEADVKTKTIGTVTLYAIWSPVVVGDTVYYTPPARTNVTINNTYATSDSTGTQTLDNTGDFEVTTWKVLSVDGKTIKMVPETVTSGTVRLQGAQGYNNAVKILNDACSDLYSNEDKGITARSITEQDFINAQDGSKWVNARATSGSSYATYNNQYTTYSSSSYRYYPSIYEQEIKSVVNGTENTNGIGWSEQNSLIGRNDSGAITGRSVSGNGIIQASSSIRPYQTAYSFSYSNATSYLKEAESSVLFPDLGTSKYWVASRCIYLQSSNCWFNVHSVSSNGFGTSQMQLCYYSTSSSDSCGLFPVVTLNSELLEKNATTGTCQIVYNSNVTYNANGGTFTGSATTNSVQYSETSNGETSQTGTYAEPTRTDYFFTGWNTKADGTGTSYKTEADVKSGTAGQTVTLYAIWKQPTNHIEYNSNGGTFTGGGTQNTVYYELTGGVETVTETVTNTVTRYSHTSNIDDSGSANGQHSENLATKDVVTIPGATSLHVEVQYSLDSNYDYLYVFTGTYTGTPSKNMSAGQLKTYTGGDSNTPNYSDSFDVTGDTATFAFYSDNVYQFYGYYAVITATVSEEVETTVDTTEVTKIAGTYSEPTKTDYVFAGWNTSADGTGTTYKTEADVKAGTVGQTVTLYAKWAKEIPVSDYGNAVNYSKTIQISSNYYTVSNWKIFGQEGEMVYIIYGDYLLNSLAATGTNPFLQTSGSYAVYSPNSRAEYIEALNTRSNWNKFLTQDLIDAGATATGSPTLEQWIDSWNKVYPEDKLYYAYKTEPLSDGSYGCYVGTATNPIGNYSITNSDKIGYSNTLYYPHTSIWNNTYGYYLASSMGEDTMMEVGYPGQVRAIEYYNPYRAIRPVITLPANYLVDAGDGTYNIVIPSAQANSLNASPSLMMSTSPKSMSLGKGLALNNNLNVETELLNEEPEETVTDVTANEEKVYVAEIGEEQYETLAEAIEEAKAKDTIKLIADVEVSEKITIDKEITIDLNSKTITTTALANITNNGNLNIKGPGTITTTEENSTILINKGELTVENVKLKVANKSSIGIQNESKAEIKGGNIIISEYDSVGILNSEKAEELVISEETEMTIIAEELTKEEQEVFEEMKNAKGQKAFEEYMAERKASVGIRNNSKCSVEVESATITVERLNGIGIENNSEGTIVIGKDDEDYNADLPGIIATNDYTIAIVNNGKGKVEMYDGSIQAQESVKDLISKVSADYEINEEEVKGVIKVSLKKVEQEEKGSEETKEEKKKEENVVENKGENKIEENKEETTGKDEKQESGEEVANEETNQATNQETSAPEVTEGSKEENQEEQQEKEESKTTNEQESGKTTED